MWYLQNVSRYESMKKSGTSFERVLSPAKFECRANVTVPGSNCNSLFVCLAAVFRQRHASNTHNTHWQEGNYTQTSDGDKPDMQYRNKNNYSPRTCTYTGTHRCSPHTHTHTHTLQTNERMTVAPCSVLWGKQQLLRSMILSFLLISYDDL